MPMGALAPESEVGNRPTPTSFLDTAESAAKSVRFSALKNIVGIPHRDDLKNTENLFWTAAEMKRFREEAIEEIQNIALALKISMEEAQYILQQPDCTQKAGRARPVWPQIDRQHLLRSHEKEMSLIEFYCLKDCLSCEHDCFLGIPTDW